MKTQSKSSNLTAVVLLVISALFSISLLLQPFDFGAMGPGKDNLFYKLGKMLYSVYGFSSILIPVFLMIAGLSCFSAKWTARKTMRLLTALIPFFTCVITENICRSIIKFSGSSFSAVKLIVAIVTGVMMMVIEFLGIGIIADKIQQKHFGGNRNGNSTTNENKFENSQKNIKLPRIRNSGKINFENEKLSDNISVSDLNQESNDTVKDDEKTAINPIFDEVFNENDDNTHESQSSEKKDDKNEDVLNVEDNFQVEADNQTENEIETQTSMITQEEFAALTATEDDSENQIDELEWNLPPQPETLPPEYDEYFDVDEKALEFPPQEDDEIETSQNLSFNENDEEIEELSSENDNENGNENNSDNENSENFNEKDGFSSEIKFAEEDEFVESSEMEVQSNIADEDDMENISSNDIEDVQIINNENNDANNIEEIEENEIDDEFEDELEIGDENKNQSEINAFNYFDIKENNVKKTTSPYYNENDPYAAANYIKNVTASSQYPSGIILHDDSDDEEDEDSSEPEIPRSKYPSKIVLGQTYETQTANDSDLEDGIQDDFVEDETLPFPEFDIETPAIAQKERIQNNYENSFDDYNDFEDNFDENELNLSVQNENDDIEDLEEVIESKISKIEPVNKVGIVSQAAQQEFIKKNHQEQNQNSEKENKSISSASDVFEQMEAEIRKDYAQKKQEQERGGLSPVENAENQGLSPFEKQNETQGLSPVEKQQHGGLSPVNMSPVNKVEIDFNGNKIEKNGNPILEGNTATNLTADELTDFFNAQQAENTPKLTEIQANPVQLGNRAVKKGPYVIPSDLLIAYKDDEYWVIDDATKNASLTLKQTLAEFNIEAKIIGIKKGPVVTMFEILPAPGVKLRKIVELQDNIALNLAAQSVRIVAPIPGKQAVGIEVPNRHRSVVGFREIIEMNLPEWKKMAVPVILGKDILGKAQLIDLVKTPHMLIAGATGSGKSVCVNSLILSILYKRSFRDVKLILVDPKVVELKLYNNIPHLLTPVITEPKKALQALKWALCEMERRYALLDQLGVRDISTYNQRIKEQEICTEKLPYIVIIIDEFADLMATSGKELETVIARLTAMSRAVGIHLVLATQRPSVNVITGLIKANIPTRIAFMVASRTDSNIIIDTNGAEKLLGRGDMLYASAVDPAPIRIQGTFVTDQEVEDVVRTVKEYGEPDYIDDEIFFDDEEDDSAKDLFGEPMDDDDPLYDQALEIVVQAGKASASYIQRKLKIGYNRAARLVEEMEERGIVGPANGSKPREIIHIP